MKSEFLEALGKVVVLAAALLPVLGILARLIAFTVGGEVPQPWRVTVGASVTDLVATGVVALVPFAAWFVAATYLLPLRTPSEFFAGLGALKRSVLVVASWGLLLGVIATAPGWPSQFVSGIGAFLAIRVVRRSAEQAGGATFWQVWPAVIIMVLASAVSAGLTLPTFGIAHGDYTFKPGQDALGLQDASYIQLGEAQGLTYLQSCSGGRSTVVAVKNDLVDRIVLTRSPRHDFGPSLWGIVWHGSRMRLGYRRCS